jgi:hypothetical protein
MWDRLRAWVRRAMGRKPSARQEEPYWRQFGDSYEEVLLEDVDFQQQYAAKLPQARERYGPQAEPCGACGEPPERLAWFWYVSEPESWQSMAGRAGWMTFCRKCRARVNFFCELRN